MINWLRKKLLGRVDTRVVEVTKDRRNVAQREAWRKTRQEAADKALEREWQRRVAENVARRRACQGAALPYPFTRQAG